ncbi:MAG: hypothetical protein QXX30_03605 [Candidatus Aenigmatarchaeota archaeon]
MIKLKGDITLSTIFEGLATIGFIAFLIFLLFFSKAMIITNIEEENWERNDINFANGLISHEKLAYEKNGILYRGILDEKKLDSIFYKSTNGLTNLEEIRLIFDPTFTKGKITKDILDLGYTNAISMIYIYDLDNCNENICVVWVGKVLPSPTIIDFIENDPLYKFSKCLRDSFSPNWTNIFMGCLGFAALGGVSGCLGGIILNLFSIGEISNCLKISTFDTLRVIITQIMTKRKGITVNIIYEDGSIHIGRLVVETVGFV